MLRNSPQSWRESSRINLTQLCSFIPVSLPMLASLTILPVNTCWCQRLAFSISGMCAEHFFYLFLQVLSKKGKKKRQRRSGNKLSFSIHCISCIKSEAFIFWKLSEVAVITVIWKTTFEFRAQCQLRGHKNQIQSGAQILLRSLQSLLCFSLHQVVSQARLPSLETWWKQVHHGSIMFYASQITEHKH